VSHEGEGHRAAPGESASLPGVMTVGVPAPGEVLAERYRLESHVNTDSVGRQIWRGIDLILRRPVALVVRLPGGEASAAMLTAAVAMSRLVHPHLVSVYDAIDERHRAYVVREWVPGVALRDVLQQSILDPERATLVTHAIAEAVSALHSVGIVHGNIHPGTILIADDGRVVLTDAHADMPMDDGGDVRAVGAVLYACLTSRWPHLEAGQSALPDAARDVSGHFATPRQVRAGIPRHLDEIASDLLDPRVPPPHADVLAAEFARLANQEPEADYDDAGPMGFGSEEHTGARRWTGGKIALGVAVLAAIAVTGALTGVRLLGSHPGQAPISGASTKTPDSATSSINGHAIALNADQVRVVDPPKGDRTELAGVDLVVDGNETTGWSTQKYNRADFGGLKPGMGILVNLGAPTAVGAVRIVVSQQGASVALRTGTTDPGDSSAGDKLISSSYTPVGQPLDDHSGTVMVFPIPDQQQQVQYLLVWITKLPVTSDGHFALAINEITVLAP
jgi:eukaryotic-like serine/threonine-protein kinase